MSANIHIRSRKVGLPQRIVIYLLKFYSVYAKDMPKRLPLLLLLRRLAQQAFMAIVFVLRAALVGTIWLAFLPWATIMTWRMYFAMGETT